MNQLVVRLLLLSQEDRHILRNSVAIDPTEVLHQSGVTVVDRTLNPLATAEVQASDDLVGGLGTSDVGI